MRVSTRFSDSIHILAFIEIYKDIRLSSEVIASSVETSPVVIRRLMGVLREAGLIATKQGSAEPKLAREPKDITLLDIYFATEGNKPLFELDKKTNPECIVGGNIQDVLGDYYEQAKISAQRKLNDTTLQDLIETILVKQKAKEIANRV
ncbi:Rrf2 family transcriptional regulator [Companilactobacillus allii]|uniref:Transcriptional regulator n=1 Tax=Companilactobacillus allii TaxID=1847728 RepID=A0A1P8Q5S4_9LACO|nr:Rrf2 family transcriptional regulator [Companilactobacillus allii]APX73187.1 transcriptional regulator [Companilactobacillus allii]USQ67995.1 Rrf2 family transcriptional regulator [Companilactobacillus allii]